MISFLVSRILQYFPRYPGTSFGIGEGVVVML